MVDFSFIVSLYVSDLLNVTIVVCTAVYLQYVVASSYSTSTSTSMGVHSHQSSHTERIVEPG